MAGSDWNAAQYLKFEDERTRPCADLLARVPLEAPALCIDLGCGPGNSTELVAQRFPGATVEGLDSSPDMLAKARARLPQLRFTQADLAAWTPERRPDLLFANAVLQWLPDHEALFGRLAGALAPGGVLAAQMPDNLDEPSHALMREVAALPAFAGTLGEAGVARTRIGSFEEHYRWLRAAGCSVDLWRTTYVHPLAGAPAIIEWLKSTGLRPYLDPLDAARQAEFLGAYLPRIAEAYPAQADGKVLLRFPRLFIVARKDG